MTCPYCKHTFPLTWRRYFKAPTGRYNCPRCAKPSRTGFRALNFFILIVVGYAIARVAGDLLNRWVGPEWRVLGIVPSILVILPLARQFESRKQLRATEAPTPPDTALCAECRRVFNVQDMVAHSGLYVCARCKPIFLQKLTEGARLGGGPGQEKP